MYSDEFKLAVDNTNNIFNSNYQFAHKDINYMTQENFSKLSFGLSKYLNHLDYASITANCSPFHYFVLPIIKNILGCNAYLTTGYIIGNNKTMFEISLNDVNICLDNKKMTSQHHTWITLDNYEVIDLTILTSIGIINGINEYIGQVVHNHPDKMLDLSYHPIIIGDDFFNKCNFNLDSLSKRMYQQ